MPKFAITGASGAGKSTLISALAEVGYQIIPEVGRRIVSEQVAAQGTALPWLDRIAFMELLFERSTAAFDAAPAGQAVFFDRSFIEAIAYCAVIGQPVPAAMLREAAQRRFDTPVFACAPWREIFVSDPERRHDFEFAVRDYEANIAAYSTAGYELIEVPRAPVPERVEFIQWQIANLPGAQPSNPREKR